MARRAPSPWLPALAMAAFLALSLALPATASASPLDGAARPGLPPASVLAAASGPIGTADNSLRRSLSELVGGVLESALDMLASSRLLDGGGVSTTSGLGGILGGTGLPGLARSVSNSLVEPVAAALVSLWALVGLLGVARGASDEARGPTLVEAFPVLATFVLSTWLVTHSTQVVESLVGFSSAVASNIPSAGAASLGATPSATSSIGRLLVELLAASIAWLSALVASVAASVALWARALELYAYAALAPLPIALVQHDRTRGAALRFMRNLVGLALSLAFTRLVLAAFPVIVASAQEAISPDGGVLPTSLAVVAACLTVTVGVRQAGSWGFRVMGD